MNYQQIKWIITLFCFSGVAVCSYWAAFTSGNSLAAFVGGVCEFYVSYKFLCGADKPDPNHKSFYKELKEVVTK